jgi:threonine/homoserine/homoserine lactone efflux protein
MNLVSFIFYCFIVTFTPGPTNIVILSTVHNKGVRKAMEYTYGATLAFGLLLAGSAVLNTLLSAVLPKVLIVMQIVGTFYMLYLAYQIYHMDASQTSTKQTGSFLTGFLMQFLNPKVVLFTMTVIPNFIFPYYKDSATISISVFAVTIIGFVAFVTWVVFGAVFKTFLQQHNKTVNIVMALFLVYATIMIWL